MSVRKGMRGLSEGDVLRHDAQAASERSNLLSKRRREPDALR
jgi:hypothetical protein